LLPSSSDIGKLVFRNKSSVCIQGLKNPHWLISEAVNSGLVGFRDVLVGFRGGEAGLVGRRDEWDCFLLFCGVVSSIWSMAMS
jgi:hypothetical protein